MLDMISQPYKSFHQNILPSITNSFEDFAKYLINTITWGIRFNRPTPLNLDKLEESTSYKDLANLKVVSPVGVNRPVPQTFTDATFGNDLTKRRSITGIFFTYCSKAIIYRSKTQTLTADSTTEVEFIVIVTALKLARYL